MDHEPGDIVDGYVLGSDMQWRRVSSLDADSVSGGADDAPGRWSAYWSRFRKRWWKAGVIWLVLGVALQLVGWQTGNLPAPAAMDLFVNAFYDFFALGTLTAFVAALVPERKR